MSESEKLGATSQRAEVDPLAGTLSYRLVRPLARGAMGEVVEAEDVRLRRSVIVKLIHDRYAKQPGFLDRFRLEAQALAALAPRTPHIVGVLDVGETPDGRPFLVLEKLTGCTLAEELAARGFLPTAEAIRFARQLLEALQCAHEAGIVHRDVKPENIFLASSERVSGGERQVKLLDFGIAKVLPGSADVRSPAPLELPTEEGTTLGTPRYLSPEQARGRAIDSRSDLYSAGGVLYAMLTGAAPFDHFKGIAALLRAQVQEPPRPPSAVASQPIPAELDRVVLKALAKSPDERFSSASEFSSALEASLLAPTVTTTAYGTEVIDVRAFRGLAARASKAQMPDKTEPLDTSIFRGVSATFSSHRAPVAPAVPAEEPAPPPAAPLPTPTAAPLPTPTAAPPVSAQPSPSPDETITAISVTRLSRDRRNIVLLLLVGFIFAAAVVLFIMWRS